MAAETSLGTDLPSNEDKWNVWTVRYNVSGSTIHDATLTSASTISEGQYSLFQVLWTPGTKADKLLATFQSWADYRKSFPNGPIREGTFALAKRYQSQAAASRDEVFQSNVAISPIANRTRSRMGNLEQKLREARLETPKKSTGKLPDLLEDEDIPDAGDSPFYSPGPEDIAHLMYPQTKEEQIASGWTLHRKSFKAAFQHASFEARTDGGSSERVRALIEVKPMLRAKKRNPIRMQEAAQMVAWIKSDPDPRGALNLPGRRLHISQDRHQIFITFAEYDESYIQYLHNTLPPKSPRPFFKMHEFGPWNTMARSDMEDIGRILLAIALRAYSDANPSKPSSNKQKSG